jgi:uncharacterized protein DUF4185
MRRAFLVLAVCACSPDAPPAGPAAAAVARVEDLGVVRNSSLSNVLRDGGAGGRVGGKILWTFGDTLFPFKAEDGATLRSCSGAYAEMSAPTVLSETVDSKGAPYQLLPFTDEERAYNAAHAPDDRYALWPTAVIPKGENALILYQRLKVHPGNLSFEAVSVGIAEIMPFDTVAARYPEIFAVPDPQPSHGAVLDAGILHLYACATSGMCQVARAPYAQATDRSAYTFFDGAAWTADATRAMAVVPGSTTGFSVTYNTYLERFVAVYSKPFTGKIVLRTAPHPEGPFSDEVAVHDVGSTIYATVQHYEIFEGAGQTMYVSYYQPTGTLQGELHLLRVVLR